MLPRTGFVLWFDLKRRPAPSESKLREWQSGGTQDKSHSPPSNRFGSGVIFCEHNPHRGRQASRQAGRQAGKSTHDTSIRHKHTRHFDRYSQSRAHRSPQAGTRGFRLKVAPHQITAVARIRFVTDHRPPPKRTSNNIAGRGERKGENEQMSRQFWGEGQACFWLGISEVRPLGSRNCGR